MSGDQVQKPAAGGGAAPPSYMTVPQRFEIYGATSLADLEYFKSLGFTQVVLDLFQFAKDASDLGLGVVLANYWDVHTAWPQVRQVVEFAKTVGTLVSINMMDEPILNGLDQHPPQAYIDIRKLIRDSGSDAPLSVTQYGPQLSWPVWWLRAFADYLPAVDVLRIDPYPVAAGDALRLVGDWAALARQMIDMTGRGLPLTVVLQTWANDGVLPSIKQLRVMAYIAMFSGADVVSFYNYDPANWTGPSDFAKGFAALMAELTGLAREFAGAKVTSVLGADDLFQAEVEHNGAWTCFTVNTSERPNGLFGPLFIDRSSGRCPRLLVTRGPQPGLLLPDRKRASPTVP